MPSTDVIKATVRRRDSFRCTQCGMANEQHLGLYGKQLHVHRLQPGTPYTVEGCVTLCHPCHGPQPKLKPGEKDLGVSRTGKPLHVWVDSEMRDAIDALAQRNRRLITTEVVMALEKHLAEAGLWPPPSKKKED